MILMMSLVLWRGYLRGFDVPLLGGCGVGVWAGGQTAFLEVNNQWIQLMTELSKQSTIADRTYWHQVGLVNLQMKGLHQGYSEAAKADSSGASESNSRYALHCSSLHALTVPFSTQQHARSRSQAADL